MALLPADIKSVCSAREIFLPYKIPFSIYIVIQMIP